MQRRCRTHAAGNLEQQLVRDLGDELDWFVKEVGSDSNLDSDEFAKSLLDKAQPHLSSLLAERVRNDNSFVRYLPAAFSAAINDLRGLS